jgi:pyruvate dehydrogenase E2 component (dihydrolipoyllysine-residue acetyltransferase)
MPEVVMPRLDPGMQTGKIVEWLKKEGEQVKKGEPILVVEGEKTTFEIEAPESGLLTKIIAKSGDDVPVTQAIAIIGDASTKPESQQTQTAPQQVATPPTPVPTPTPSRPQIIASPAARRLAQEQGVDISQVTGSGPGGRITSDDIMAATKKTTTQTVTQTRGPLILKRSKLEGIRKAVAERLSYSARNVVPVTITMEADATTLVGLKEKESHIAFTALAVKAIAKSLEKHLIVNSALEGDEIVTYSQINVALAIHTDQGLVAPVIQNTNKKTLREINTEINELAEKARANRLTIENLTGGTFTVTNLGAYDVESFAPIINPPQCAILGLGRIAYKPVAVGSQVISKPTTMLTLVFDHRIIDGVPAARFLQEIKSNLENAEGLL